MVERLFKHCLHGSVMHAQAPLVVDATRVLDLVDVRLKEPIAAAAAERHRRPVDLVIPCMRLEVTAPTHKTLSGVPSGERRGVARVCDHREGDSPVWASDRRLRRCLRAVEATAAAATRLEDDAAVEAVHGPLPAPRRAPLSGRLAPRLLHLRRWKPGRKLRDTAGRA